MSNKIVLSEDHFSKLTENPSLKNKLKGFNEYNALLSKYNIVTPKSIAAFFAQIKIESSDFTSLSEKFNTGKVVPINTEGDVDEPDYSQFVKDGDGFFNTRYDTIKVNNKRVQIKTINGKKVKVTSWRNKNHKIKQVDNNHLGNTHPGDGSLFRGRGFLQNTGRANYENITKKIRQYNRNIDLIKNPTDLKNVAIAFEVAAFTFMDDNLIPVAEHVDTTRAQSIYNTNRKITHTINGGFNKVKERLDAYVSALSIMECLNQPIKDDPSKWHIAKALEKLQAVEKKPKALPDGKNMSLSNHETAKDRVTRAVASRTQHGDNHQAGQPHSSDHGHHNHQTGQHHNSDHGGHHKHRAGHHHSDHSHRHPSSHHHHRRS